MNDVSFRPLTTEDLPTLARWLREEHVLRWWKDPDAADRVESEYVPAIKGDEPTDFFLVLWGGREVGLVESYRVDDYPEWGSALAPSGLTFEHAAGIDYLIGEPDLVGRGIGSAAIEAFTADLFDRAADVETIVVAPQQANGASCRILEKAGYRLVWTGMLDSEDPSDAGTAAMYVLRRDER